MTENLNTGQHTTLPMPKIGEDVVVLFPYGTGSSPTHNVTEKNGKVLEHVEPDRLRVRITMSAEAEYLAVDKWNGKEFVVERSPSDPKKWIAILLNATSN